MGIREKKITISARRKGEASTEYRIISIRLKSDLLEQVDAISAQSNRSRNEIINLLLDAAIQITEIQE